MRNIDTKILIKILEKGFAGCGEFTVRNQRFFFRASESVLKSMRNRDNYWPRESEWFENKTSLAYAPKNSLSDAHTLLSPEHFGIVKLKQCFPSKEDRVNNLQQCFHQLFDQMVDECDDDYNSFDTVLHYVNLVFTEYDVDPLHFEQLKNLKGETFIAYLISHAYNHTPASQIQTTLQSPSETDSFFYLKNFIKGHIVRQSLLEKIQNIINTNKICVISDGPSAGKTSLAISYALSYPNIYETNKIIFLNCETLSDLYSSLEVTNDLVQVNASELPKHKIQLLNIINDRLSQHGKTLIIFDNIGYDHDTRQHSKISGFEDFMINLIDEIKKENVDIIVTTRLSETRFKYGEHLLFDGFNHGELLSYFVKQTTLPVKVTDVDYILKKFGSKSSDGEYYILPGIAALAKDIAIMKNSFKAVIDIHMIKGSSSLITLFSAILDQLENGTPYERLFKTILEITSFLDTEQIPKELFEWILKEWQPHISTDTIHTVLDEYCIKLSILKKQENTYYIHRSYHSCIYRLINDKTKKDYIKIILQAFEKHIEKFSYYGYSQLLIFKRYFRHMASFFTRIEPQDYLNYPEIIVQMAWYVGNISSDYQTFLKYHQLLDNIDIPLYLKGLLICDNILIELKLGICDEDRDSALNSVKEAMNNLMSFSEWELDILDIRYHLAYSEYLIQKHKRNISVDCAFDGLHACELALSSCKETASHTFFKEHKEMLKVQIGRAYRIGINNHQKALEILENAYNDIVTISNNYILKPRERQNYKMIEAQILNDIAVNHFECEDDSKNYPMALDYYKKSYKIFKEINYYSRMATEYMNIANLYRNWALKELDNNESFATENFYTYISNFRKYIEKAYKIREENTVIDVTYLKDYYSYYYLLSIAEAKNNLCSNQEKITILNEGIHFLEKALLLIRNTRFILDECLYKRYEGVHHRKIGQLSSDILLKKEAYSKAKECLFDSLRIADSHSLEKAYCFAAIELGMVQALNNEFTQSKETFSSIKKRVSAFQNTSNNIVKRYEFVKNICLELESQYKTPPHL